MGFTAIVSAVSVVSFWATVKVKQLGDKILGPVSAYKGLKLTSLSAPSPSGATKFNMPVLLALVGLLFGAGYLLKGVAAVTKG